MAECSNLGGTTASGKSSGVEITSSIAISWTLTAPTVGRSWKCWKYSGVRDLCRGKNLRLLDIRDRINNELDSDGRPLGFDESLRYCLKRGQGYGVLKPDGAGELQGGLRLVMCERANMAPTLTLSRVAFEEIEQVFNLHHATLPAFLDNGGDYCLHKVTNATGEITKIQIVVKVVQKREICNCLLSLTYDAASCWTDAFICGNGIVLDRKVDHDFDIGRQEEQLLASILSAGPASWTNPLLLPVTVLQVCARRRLEMSRTRELRMVDVEDHLGVIFTGWSDEDQERPDWPMDIDVKWATRQLHTVLPQILFMTSVTAWQSRYAQWLLDKATDLADDPSPGGEEGFADIKSSLGFVTSSVEGMGAFFQMLKGRTQSQIDLLFSVATQRDAMMSQRASELNLEVARATKEDSISISTFTFITAIFLPATFVATLFSVNMFDWSDGNGGAGSHNTLSGKFWIFWAVTGPLTALTMTGWYVWYRHADKKWQISLDQVNNRAARSVNFADREGYVGTKNQEWRESNVHQSKGLRSHWLAEIGRRRHSETSVWN